jgi:hypothetical protein
VNKYFYTDGESKFGPFSKEELKEKGISRETLVWYYGLEAWTPLSDLEELNEVSLSIPPELENKRESTPGSESKEDNVILELPQKTETTTKTLKLKKPLLILGGVIIFLVVVSRFVISERSENELYRQIVADSYDGDEDFEMYLNKFYRDLEYHGIYPKKPLKTIIKFSELDKLKETTHYHGVSFGYEDDDLIEIYINPSSWEKFSKPQRYYLMYHELSHDLLNKDDLPISVLNEGKLMYPEFSRYDKIDMDDFIESAHELFEEHVNE